MRTVKRKKGKKSEMGYTERVGGRSERERKSKGEGEASGNESWNLFSAGGESGAQTSRQISLSVLSIHPSMSHVLLTHHRTRAGHSQHKEERTEIKQHFLFQMNLLAYVWIDFFNPLKITKVTVSIKLPSKH